MSDFGPRTYGEPCSECGFSWGVSPESAVRIVRDAPKEFAALLTGSTGSERHPELAWSAVAYVSHVVDNLRIWAERLAGVAAGADPTVASYDNELLARARQYDKVSLSGALWSLRRAVGDWLEAVSEAEAAGVVLVHPGRGELRVLDVVRSNAHDTFHHRWDIARSLNAPA